MNEFYGIMAAASQASQTEDKSDKIEKLLRIHEEYLTRFKLMCEQIEQKLGQNSYLLGDKPSIVDFVFYQELVSAMIISGKGTESDFLESEKLAALKKWYK